MAGYVFLLSGDDAKRTLEEAFLTGTFSPLVAVDSSKKQWGKGALGAFGDLITMCPNDRIFFFSKRIIYGVGKAISLSDDRNCVYNNFIEASIPCEIGIKENCLVVPVQKKVRSRSKMEIKENRWVCTFEPNPSFYDIGIDMDDLLNYAPSQIKMLRAMQSVSFIKIDDDEADSIQQFLYLRVETNDKLKKYPFDSSYHLMIKEKLTEAHSLHAKQLVSLANKTREGEVSNEMVIEIAILQMLHDRSQDIFSIQYDYISQQVPASPFKPVAYMDKIDIFAYSNLYEILGEALPIRARNSYLILEIKKGKLPNKKNDSTIPQILKYVDYVAAHYAGNDYSRIKAAIVAFDFPEKIIDQAKLEVERNYTLWMHPSAESRVWSDLSLIKYHFSESALTGIELEELPWKMD